MATSRYLRDATETTREFRAFLAENPALADGLASVGNLLINAVRQSEYGPALEPFLGPPGATSRAAKDVVDTAVAAGGFENLAVALQATDLVDTLKGDGPYTVFAPTDEAFAALPEGTLDELLEPKNRERLKAALLHHVVEGRVAVGSIERSLRLTTLGGDRLRVKARRGDLRVDGAGIVKADVRARNGIVHAIDAVLLPDGA